MNSFETKKIANIPEYTMELTASDLDDVFDNPDHTANDVMKLFYKDYDALYRATTGTIESYSLGRHTRMVLDQYFKYFKGKELPVVNEKFFESLLALHDIGKPLAAIDGDIEKQYEYTVEILNKALPKLGFSESEKVLVICLVDGDPIRKFFYKRDTDINEIVEDIQGRAKTAGLDIKDFWTLLKTYWMVDAGSYTVDAGGNESLDRMFEFEPDDGEMFLAPKIEERLSVLEEKLFEIEPQIQYTI